MGRFCLIFLARIRLVLKVLCDAIIAKAGQTVLFFPKKDLVISEIIFHMDSSIEIKVAFLGESGVGKTTIIQSFDNIDVPTQAPTLGASFSMHYVKVDDDVIRLKIWDTAGQEKFKSLAPLYYRDSKIIVRMRC